MDLDGTAFENRGDSEPSIFKQLASDLLLNRVTDDNPSPTNGLTGYEQTIASVLGYSPSRDYNQIQIVKKKVLGRMFDLQGGAYLENVDSLSFEPYVFELVREEEELMKIYRDLAIDVMNGILTDDNRSKVNGLTGLEQAICSFFEYYPKSEYPEILRIKNIVLGIYIGMRGGSDLSDSESFKLDQSST